MNALKVWFGPLWPLIGIYALSIGPLRFLVINNHFPEMGRRAAVRLFSTDADRALAVDVND